jgi:hypothetical protein
MRQNTTFDLNKLCSQLETAQPPVSLCAESAAHTGNAVHVKGRGRVALASVTAHKSTRGAEKKLTKEILLCQNCLKCGKT